MSKNPYAHFDTDQNAEASGVWVNYGEFRVLLARAGGSNEDYNNAFDRKARALRRTGVPGTKRLELIALELLAESCVKKWEIKDETGKWASGIYMPDTGKVEPFSVQKVKDLFNQFPELAKALLAEANSVELYNAEGLEEEAGN